jgi:transcriptional regulator with XRE-family HTH domain
MTQAKQPEGEVFGRRLRELRLERGMTQHALAAASGLTDAYVSNMENGFAVPSLTTVLRLAVALGCRVGKLVAVFDQTDLVAILPK